MQLGRSLVFLLVLWPSLAWCQIPDLCRAPIAAAERESGVPDRLMQSIAIIESGRRDPNGPTTAWPWTINVEGVGQVFDTKPQAIAAVMAHQARGARSIDVGCMQVNLMHHASAFATLDEAFDPVANARYAARFLLQLLAQTGSWPLAVAGYHSLTPDIGGDYAKKVLAIWAKPELGRSATRMAHGNAPPAPEKFAANTSSPPVVAGPGNASSGGASLAAALPPPTRLFTAPGGMATSVTGRGLDAYRAAPTRLATAMWFKRS